MDLLLIGNYRKKTG